MSWPSTSRALASPITSMTMNGSMALRLASGRHVLGFRGGHSELVHEQRTGGFVAAWQAAPVTVSPYSNANQSQVCQRRGSKGPVPHNAGRWGENRHSL